VRITIPGKKASIEKCFVKMVKSHHLKNKKEAKNCNRSINIFLKELWPGKLNIIIAIV
jgi:hypothetical protein